MWPSFRKDSEGTRSSFYCLSTGKRPLTVTWSRIDNKPLSPRAQTDSRKIVISRIEKDDEGGYVCTVKNNYGQHTARGTLSVLGKKCAGFHHTSCVNEGGTEGGGYRLPPFLKLVKY